MSHKSYRIVRFRFGGSRVEVILQSEVGDLGEVASLEPIPQLATAGEVVHDPFRVLPILPRLRPFPDGEGERWDTFAGLGAVRAESRARLLLTDRTSPTAHS